MKRECTERGMKHQFKKKNNKEIKIKQDASHLRNKQITIEHNFINNSYSYMVRPHGVTNGLDFRTYRTVEVRSYFLQIYLQFFTNK